MSNLELNEREIASVLVGLRLRQQQLAPQRGGSNVEEIADNVGEWEALNVEEIDRLCDRLLYV